MRMGVIAGSRRSSRRDSVSLAVSCGVFFCMLPPD